MAREIDRHLARLIARARREGVLGELRISAAVCPAGWMRVP